MTGGYVAGRRRNMAVLPLLDEAIEDLQVDGVQQFISAELVALAAKKLPMCGPAEVARLAKGVKNMVLNGKLRAVDSRKVPGIKRPVSVYVAVDLCPLAGAELQASIQGWMQPRV